MNERTMTTSQVASRWDKTRIRTWEKLNKQGARPTGYTKIKGRLVALWRLSDVEAIEEGRPLTDIPP